MRTKVSRLLPTIVDVPKGCLSYRWRVDRPANIETRVIRLLCSIDLNILSHSPAPFVIFLV
jgi:hypothetical protein